MLETILYKRKLKPHYKTILFFWLIYSIAFGWTQSLSANPLTIQIGMTEWASQNLNTTSFRNGDPIPQAKTTEEWSKAATDDTPAW